MTNAKDLKWLKLDSAYGMPEIDAIVKEERTGHLVFGYFAENTFMVRNYDDLWEFVLNDPPYYYIPLELPQ